MRELEISPAVQEKMNGNAFSSFRERSPQFKTSGFRIHNFIHPDFQNFINVIIFFTFRKTWIPTTAPPLHNTHQPVPLSPSEDALRYHRRRRAWPRVRTEHVHVEWSKLLHEQCCGGKPEPPPNTRSLFQTRLAMSRTDMDKGPCQHPSRS